MAGDEEGDDSDAPRKRPKVTPNENQGLVTTTISEATDASIASDRTDASHQKSMDASVSDSTPRQADQHAGREAETVEEQRPEPMCYEHENGVSPAQDSGVPEQAAKQEGDAPTSGDEAILVGMTTSADYRCATCERTFPKQTWSLQKFNAHSARCAKESAWGGAAEERTGDGSPAAEDVWRCKSCGLTFSKARYSQSQFANHVKNCIRNKA